jgi:hypothetical protein
MTARVEAVVAVEDAMGVTVVVSTWMRTGGAIGQLRLVGATARPMKGLIVVVIIECLDNARQLCITGRRGRVKLGDVGVFVLVVNRMSMVVIVEC